MKNTIKISLVVVFISIAILDLKYIFSSEKILYCISDSKGFERGMSKIKTTLYLDKSKHYLSDVSSKSFYKDFYVRHNSFYNKQTKKYDDPNQINTQKEIGDFNESQFSFDESEDNSENNRGGYYYGKTTFMKTDCGRAGVLPCESGDWIELSYSVFKKDASYSARLVNFSAGWKGGYKRSKLKDFWTRAYTGYHHSGSCEKKSIFKQLDLFNKI
jgi:hypothetical protein